MLENVNTNVGKLVGLDHTNPNQTKLCQDKTTVDMYSHMTVNIISKSHKHPQTTAAESGVNHLTDPLL